ncbi:MAG: hypothetical protein ACOY3Z_12655 [Thermodesulfobacteriota bacterium]
MEAGMVGVGFSAMAKAMAQQKLGLEVLAGTLAGLSQGQLASATSEEGGAGAFRRAVRAADGVGRSIDTVA